MTETNETMTVAMQYAANRGMVFSARSSKQKLNSNKGAMFSVQSVPRCYKQDKSRVQLVEWSGVE
jgi:hypothetical protein